MTWRLVNSKPDDKEGCITSQFANRTNYTRVTIFIRYSPSCISPLKWHKISRLPLVRRNWGQQKFVYSIFRDWNTLDPSIRDVMSFSLFRTKAKSVILI